MLFRAHLRHCDVIVYRGRGVLVCILLNIHFSVQHCTRNDKKQNRHLLKACLDFDLKYFPLITFFPTHG